MGFFRVGIGRRGVSLGLGPVTFYGGGRKRKRTQKAPGCALCGSRTPNRICASCRRELEASVKDTAPVFINSLSMSVSESNMDIRNKALRTAKRSLDVLNKCASYGVTWEDIKSARNNLRLANSLNRTYELYRKTFDAKHINNPKKVNSRKKLEDKYAALASRVDGIVVTPLHRLVATGKEDYAISEPPEAIEAPVATSSVDPLQQLSKILTEVLPIGRTSGMDVDLRVNAYNMTLSAIDRVVQAGAPAELVDSIAETKNTVIEERRALLAIAQGGSK